MAELLAEVARNQTGETNLRALPSLVPRLAKDGAALPGRADDTTPARTRRKPE
jgi:hypothetical protein